MLVWCTYTSPTHLYINLICILNIIRFYSYHKVFLFIKYYKNYIKYISAYFFFKEKIKTYISWWSVVLCYI